MALYALSGDNPDFKLIKEGLSKEPIDEGEIRDCLLHLYWEKFIYCEVDGKRTADYSDAPNAHYLISFIGKFFF